MADKYSNLAADLQRGVISDEDSQLASGHAEYSEARARQAVVHTPHDLVMVISHLSSLNQQVRTIRWLLWVTISLLAILVIE